MSEGRVLPSQFGSNNPEPASRYRIHHLYFLCSGVARPPNSQRVSGCLASQIGNLETCGGRRRINYILGHGPRESEIDFDSVHIRRGITPSCVSALGLRSFEWNLWTCRKTRT